MTITRHKVSYLSAGVKVKLFADDVKVYVQIISSHDSDKLQWASGSPQTLRFPFNISATNEGSDFKTGMQVGFTKAHHEIPSRRKSGRGHKLGELPIMLGFPFNISATAEASNFKFGMQLGFAKAHDKITPREKVGVAHG